MHNLTFKLAKVALILVLILFIVYTFTSSESLKEKIKLKYGSVSKIANKVVSKSLFLNQFNVWIIFTKVVEKSPLTFKFKNLITNMLDVSSVPLKFHLFVDDRSKILAGELFENLKGKNRTVFYEFFDVAEAAAKIQDIVEVMTPYFSSKPGTYYSDALFYLSLGLYRIAPESQETAIMLDCDLYFKKDVALLFNQFKTFNPGNLFGLSPELTPVYRHVLHTYRTKHKTTFGEYFHSNEINLQDPHPQGFQGYNSGVILFNLTAIRKSEEYANLIKKDAVSELATKYKFKGHLGDQDFYTLMGYTHPNLIKTLGCGFNRQLCTWWRDNGYKEVFDFYAKCDEDVVLLHGNCNTRIPIR